jgi:glycosyltransferase 2 family protein
MPKHTSTILRILVAAAGIGYIAYSLTWTDHVVVPPGHPLAVQYGLTPAKKPHHLKVVAGDLSAENPSAELVLSVAGQAGSGKADTATVRMSAFGTGGGDLQRQPGVLRTLRSADVGELLLGLVIVGPAFLFLTLRWWVLLVARGLDVTLGKTFRLTMAGAFFNYCMPGTTGGDVIKAFYAARGSGRKTDAVMTIIVDRAAGLSALFVLAGVAGLFTLDQPIARQVALYVGVIVVVGVACAAAYFSRRLRAVLRLDAWLPKLPGGKLLALIDEAAVAYRNHLPALAGSVALGVGVHICLVTGTAMAGYSLGIEAPLGVLLTIIPVLLIVAAVPISPQGLGTTEAVGMALLVTPGLAHANQMVGMLLLWRVYQMAYSMLGALILLKGDIHLHPQEETARGVGPSGGAASEPAERLLPTQ